MNTAAATLGALLVALALVGCSAGPDSGDDDDHDDHDAGPDGPDGGAPFEFVRCETPADPLPELLEDRRVYQPEATPEVLEVELSILDAAAFEDVNENVEGALAPVIFRSGGVGDGVGTANATIQVRGGASRVNKQKNYKIKLTVDGQTWRSQREINLNKHMWDLTRVRNKMAFDLFRSIPNFTSLRTQFVHMTVDGEDYGLYTWIEEAEKRFLVDHGLDPDGQIYKPTIFFFAPIEPEVVADPLQMDEVIEPKANADHAKLLRMIDAVNDEEQDIDAVIDTYFNRANLETWLAVNVLLNNIDTLTQNYFLYSPSSCEGWYFLPWDYDAAWGFYGQLEEDDRKRWERGLSTYWPSFLFRRYFTRIANVEAIHDRILALADGVLTDEAVAERLAAYHDLIEPYIAAPADLYDLPGHYGDMTAQDGIDLWDAEQDRISTTPSRFLAEYLDVRERPMPIRIVFLGGSPAEFHWEDAFDLQHDPITYDFQVSWTSEFEPADIVAETLGMTGDDATASLDAGTYYWRVIIRDGHADSWQLPIDPYKEIVIP
jgi:spore coat protein H